MAILLENSNRPWLRPVLPDSHNSAVLSSRYSIPYFGISLLYQMLAKVRRIGTGAKNSDF
jgi:hypothetical protein